MEGKLHAKMEDTSAATSMNWSVEIVYFSEQCKCVYVISGQLYVRK
jgi:hypothetical protein